MKKLSANKIIMLLTNLSLMLGFTWLYPAMASAATLNVPLIFSSSKSTGAGAALGGVPIGAGGDMHVSDSGPTTLISVWELDPTILSASCNSDIISLDISSVFTYSNAITSGADGAFLWLGDSTTFTEASSPSVVSGSLMPGFPITNGVGWSFTGLGGTNPPSSPIDLSAKWPITALSHDVVAIVDTDDNNFSDNLVLTKPVATLTIDDSSTCVPSVPISTDPDVVSILAGASTTINILGNDSGSNLAVSKIDGQAITPGQTITLANGSGTVKLNNDGTITFTPTSGFTGESSFSYSITDGTNTVDTGAVKITVTADSTPKSINSSTNTTAKTSLAETGENKLIISFASTALLIAASLLVKLKKKVNA